MAQVLKMKTGTKRKRRLTNVQLVKDIMENSKYGALAQMFVMDALLKLSDAVVLSTPSDYEGSMVHGPAWIGLGKEIQEKLKRE